MSDLWIFLQSSSPITISYIAFFLLLRCFWVLLFYSTQSVSSCPLRFYFTWLVQGRLARKHTVPTLLFSHFYVGSIHNTYCCLLGLCGPHLHCRDIFWCIPRIYHIWQMADAQWYLSNKWKNGWMNVTLQEQGPFLPWPLQCPDYPAQETNSTNMCWINYLIPII